MEGRVLRKFREILYGALFGLGAVTIDIVMHAKMHGQGLIEEIMHPEPWMAFYRGLYFAFGVILGWALWRSNKKERRFRVLLKQFCDIIDLSDGHATVIYASAQVLLMQETCTPPENAAASIGVLYEHVQQVRVLTNKLSELANA
jgi:hypothetical protein